MRTFVVKPRKAGLWVVTAAALLAGWLKSEIALMAAGAFLALLAAYSLAAALVLACAHRRRAASLRVRIHPAVLDAGGRAALCLEQPASFWQLPACLVRYRLALHSADGRHIAARFPPEIFAALPCEFPVHERGAFFAPADFLEIFDCFGFWTARLTLVREEAARLCVTVPPLELPAAARAQHGGDGGRDERRAVKSPELLDNRAYIPGDDPRRINWKLYGHSGDLYVRTESADRPPRACLTLIVDTEFDGALFTPTAARAAVDALCAAALAFARDARRHGDAAHILYTRPPRPLDTPHLRPQECSPEADAHTLAYPAALPLGTGRLPPPSPDALPHLAEAAPLLDAVYFALPRTRMPASALERFTRGWPATGRLAVVFICTNDALSSAARENVRWCGGKEGVYADAMRV